MTAQIAEKLLYQGERVAMCTNPLSDYFAMGGFIPRFMSNTTALWLGYVGDWEIVADPLKAVPGIPFGHLHQAWAKFLADLPEEAEVWSYSAQWTTNRGGEELRKGYVAIQENVLGAFILTTRKYLSDEG